MPIAGMIEKAVTAQPKFTNASKLFALTGREELKVVRVVQGTANLTNGHVLIRRYVGIPDGVYDVNMDGSLSPTRYAHGMRYPDIEMIRPPFETMIPSCELPNAAMGPMIQLCQEARKVDGKLILSKEGVYMLQNPQVNFAFPLGLTAPNKVDPKYFEIALIEMLQYPSVYLLQENRPTDVEGPRTPLVLGLDWGSCALLMPLAQT